MNRKQINDIVLEVVDVFEKHNLKPTEQLDMTFHLMEILVTSALLSDPKHESFIMDTANKAFDLCVDRIHKRIQLDSIQKGKI